MPSSYWVCDEDFSRHLNIGDHEIKMMNEHYYALIMAGGGGTRLWPLSRKDRPKQALPLVDEQSMFRVSVERLLPLFPPERIFVVTGAVMADGLREDVPEIPEENFVIEPFAQNSGPAAGLGTLQILAQDPEAIIAVLTADHHISDIKGFHGSLKSAYEMALKGYIVTLGISPSYPAIGFGYIERGEFIERVAGLDVYHSNRFVEKPDLETAIQFLASGKFSWNSGMFIWQAKQAFAEFEKQQPDMHQYFTVMIGAYGTPEYQKIVEERWQYMTKIPIDYAIMEGAKDVAVIPVDIGWSDIGSWSALYDVLADNISENTKENILRGTNGTILPLDTSGTLVYSNRKVVTIGVSDIVIVDTDDVLLVCHRDHAQDVRKAVNHLREAGDDHLL